MTSSEHTSTSAATSAETTETETAASVTPSGVGAGPEGGPVPGDPSTEPVATAAQSHVAGRVGPPSIAQDSDAPWHSPEGVGQIQPGQVLDASTVIEGGYIPQAGAPESLAAGPLGSDTEPDAAPNTVHATKPGTDEPGLDELPPNTPLPGDKASASGFGDGTTASDPRAGSGSESGTSGTSATSTTADSASPTSPTAGPSSSSSSGDDVTASPSSSGATTTKATDSTGTESDAGSSGSTTGAGDTSSTSSPSSSGTSDKA